LKLFFVVVKLVCGDFVVDRWDLLPVISGEPPQHIS
jgi:hypothetical protein